MALKPPLGALPNLKQHSEEVSIPISSSSKRLTKGRGDGDVTHFPSSGDSRRREQATEHVFLAVFLTVAGGFVLTLGLGVRITLCFLGIGRS